MVEGVDGNNKIDGQRYTMQSLNIASESRAASIFNEIDMSDGRKDNSLTQEQYNKFSKEYLGNMPQDELIDAIGSKTFRKLNETYLQQFVNKDGTHNLNELKDSLSKLLIRDNKNETRNEEIKLVQEFLEFSTGEKFSVRETKKILGLLGFLQENTNQTVMADL